MNTRRSFAATAAIALAATGVVASAGCGASSAYYDFSSPKSAQPGVMLSVVNRCIEDVRVYLLRGGTRVRVGIVGGMESRNFEVSPAVLGGSGVLRLAVETLASRTGVTLVPVDVVPGQTVEARIAGNIKYSTVVARF